MYLIYALYLVINFAVTLLVWCIFADRIGHINYEFCKAHVNLPIKNNSSKELNWFPQSGAITDKPMMYDYVLYNIIYKLHFSNNTITISNFVVSLIGFVVIHFIDSVSLILIIVFSGIYLIS